jgi:hypothetical protein
MVAAACIERRRAAQTLRRRDPRPINILIGMRGAIRRITSTHGGARPKGARLRRLPVHRAMLGSQECQSILSKTIVLSVYWFEFLVQSRP